MSWLFPDWVESDPELQNIFDTLGIYAYANPDMSSGNCLAMDIHIFDMQKVVTVLPEHCKERFFKQYIWLRNILLKENELIKANDVINKNILVLGVDKARKSGIDYLNSVLSKYDIKDITVLFAISMGIPIQIHMVDSSNIKQFDDFLSELGIENVYDEFCKYMEEYGECQDEAFD